MKLIHLKDPMSLLSEFKWNGPCDLLMEKNIYVGEFSTQLILWAKGAEVSKIIHY